MFTFSIFLLLLFGLISLPLLFFITFQSSLLPLDDFSYWKSSDDKYLVISFINQILLINDQISLCSNAELDELLYLSLPIYSTVFLSKMSRLDLICNVFIAGVAQYSTSVLLSSAVKLCESFSPQTSNCNHYCRLFKARIYPRNTRYRY